jgi:hypothetical protein
MKKVMKWLVLAIFVSSSMSFAIVQTKPGADDPIFPGAGGCKSAVARNTTGCK